MISPTQNQVPLCVDLDGTLILSDVLWESLVQLWKKPFSAFRVVFSALRGKAALKATLAEVIELAPESLPYREPLVEWLVSERALGRKILLVTATHGSVAARIAHHLGIFDEVIASDGLVNLGGRAKRDALVARFGEKGFDYVGDHNKDLVVFRHSRQAILADPSPWLARKAGLVAPIERTFQRSHKPLKTFLRAIRIHQWSKNALLGVPLVTAHLAFDPLAWLKIVVAAASFSLLASATYLINDLHDLDSDRKHEKKRFRPLASGALSIPAGLGICALLAALSFMMAFWFLNPPFVAFLTLYALLTLAYSFVLKQKMIVDALTLAALYTIRIIAGTMALGVTVSEWLLMFSLFFFVSLALVKRFVELEKAKGTQLPGRGYSPTDTDVVLSVGTTSGMISVLVFAMYISESTFVKYYQTPQLLWLICPLLIYWMTRIWFLAKRGLLHHDPIVFALVDWRSYAVGGMAGAILLLANFSWKGVMGL